MDYLPLMEEVTQMLNDEVPAQAVARRILQALDGHQHGVQAMMGVLAVTASRLLRVELTEPQDTEVARDMVLDVLDVLMVLGHVDPDEAVKNA